MSGRSLILLAISVSILLVTVVFVPVPGEYWLLSFFGRFHPLLVHLPIGILLALFFLELVQLLRPSSQLGPACGLLLWIAVASAIPTVIAGSLLARSESYGSEVFLVHQWMGLLTALLSIWLLVLRNQIDLHPKYQRWYRGTLFINILVLSIAGHYGGSLTHGSDYLTESLPPEFRMLFEEDPLDAGGLESMTTSLIDQTLENFNYEHDIKPITITYCMECHGEEEQKGGLRLDNIDPDLLSGHHASTWRGVLDMINSGEMPPEEEKQLTDEERRTIVNWITASIHHAVEVRKSEQKPVIRRLTKDQYTNSLMDLLNVSVRFGDVLPDDGKSEMGFSNNGQVLQISPLHIEYYKSIAREALDKAIAPEVKPKSTYYRITFGKGIGIDKTAAMIGGYQSAPIKSDDFMVDILDEFGNPIIGEDSAQKAELDEVKKNIGVGMRGSAADRYQVVDDGIMLYSALPHKEVTPKSWQGPSPNLKLLFRDHFPMEGDFEFRVKASRGYQLYTQRVGFISLRDQIPAEPLESRTELLARDGERLINLQLNGNALVPEALTEYSRALFKFMAPEDGYYQFDFVHPYAAEDAMPSMFLRVDKHIVQERLHLQPELSKEPSLTTPITLAYLEKGQHILEIGGAFFIGFEKVIITHYPEEHQLSKELLTEAEKSKIKYQNDDPVLRTFAGTRTDDGMDYLTFDSHRVVDADSGEVRQYIFKGRLENLPIPMIDSVETEILANIMVIGLWNDFLVKDNEESGPPLLIKEIEFEAPFYPQWPPASHERIFIESENVSNPSIYTHEVIGTFIERAFRRPAEAAEVDRYLGFWESIKDDYPRYEDGVKEVLIAVLCSPNFIYLAEPEEWNAKNAQDYFLAARLSYFLWNGPPDSELIQLAKNGKLHKKRVLKKQVARMLQDERSWEMTEAFTHEWLRVDRHLGMSTNVNEYPDYTRYVKKDMELETAYFVHYLLQNDQSIFSLIESEFAMLNQNLAEFYGIDSVRGSHFRPVQLASEQRRGGLLSQGAFLAGHSDGTQAHAIKRAVWLRSRILGDRPPDPPPNVPELDPETPGFENLTLKEQLFIHRENPSCMDCHKKIDPYGIVFENYDAVGRFQLTAKGRPVDTQAELPDGKSVNGIDEIKSYILNERSNDFTRSLVSHMFSYALGRDVTFVDEKEINTIVKSVRDDDYRFQSVVEHIVTSDSFMGTY